MGLQIHAGRSLDRAECFQFGQGAVPLGDVFLRPDPLGRHGSLGIARGQRAIFYERKTFHNVNDFNKNSRAASNPWAKIVVDAEGKTAKSYFDAFGRVTQIVNVTSGGNINTYFKYDPVGNLTNVTDHSNNLTRISYDSLGRKTSMVDPDMGTWSYFYDKAGRLTNQVDAKSQKIAFFFNDVLGRMSKKEVYNASGNLTNVTVFGYDTNLSGFGAWKGAVTSVKDTNGWVRSGFDARGRVVLTTRHLNKNNTDYTAQTTFNEADQPVDVTYPGGTTVVLRHSYTNGILYKLQSVQGTGGATETFYQLGALNELGQAISYATHNGGVATSSGFFPNSKRLQQMRVTKPGGGYHQDLSYKFDKVSNVKHVSEGVTGYSGNASGGLTNAVYDDLHRLTQYSNARGTFVNTYDALGNVRKLGETSTNLYQYTSIRPHAVTLAHGKSYSYDNNGNMIVRGAQILAYDAENRLSEVNSNGVITAFGYAEDGGRIWKQTASGLQVWVGGLYEEKGGRVLCHVFAGGKRLATFEPVMGGPYFAGLWAPKTLWTRATETLTAATSWPFAEGRTPATVLLSTLLLVLFTIISARRGFRSLPSSAAGPWILRTLAKFLPLLGGEGRGEGGPILGRDAFHRVRRIASSGRTRTDQITDDVEIVPTGVELTARERRWYRQPLWSQALSVFMMVVLIFTTRPRMFRHSNTPRSSTITTGITSAPPA